MQNLTFDSNGNLTPYEIINLDLKIFKKNFVDPFNNSNTRVPIFNGYLRYCSDFGEQITDDFFQWLDGSYVTAKENPSDIDLIVLVNSDTANKNSRVYNFLTIFSNSKKRYFVDAYKIDVYPETDPRHKETMNDFKYWLDWFCKDRAGNPKGIIQIQYSNLETDDING